MQVPSLRWHQDPGVVPGVAEEASRLGLLEEDGMDLAHTALQIGPAQLRRHGSGPAGPLLPDGNRNLLQVRRRGSGPDGVGEDVNPGKAAFPEKGQGFLEFLLSLAGKTGNQVRGDGGTAEGLIQQLHGLEIPGGVILPVHPLQGGVAPALQGQVELMAQVRQHGRPAAEGRRDGSGLQTAQPETHAGDGGAEGLQQVHKGQPRAQVPAPGGNLDAGEHQLPVALLRQLSCLGGGILERQ